MQRIVWLGCLAYLLTGLAQVVVGANLPELLPYYGGNYSSGGNLIFTQYVGMLGGVLTAPFISAIRGKRFTILTAYICMAIGNIAITLLPPWPLLLPASAVSGFGFGIIEASVGALVISSVVDRPAAAMGRLEVCFGVGALAMPFITGVLISFGLWRYSFLCIALMSILAFLFWFRFTGQDLDRSVVRSGPPRETASQRKPNLRSRILPHQGKQLRILILFIAFFLIYCGVEMSLVNFMPAIFIEKLQAEKSLATLSVTCFWGAMAFGRLFSGVIAERMRYGPFLLASSICTAAAAVLFALSNTLWMGLSSTLLLGLAMSGIFSVALVFVNALLPNLTDATTSYMIFFSGLGAALWPLAVGYSLDLSGTANTVWLLVLVAFMMLAISVITFRLPARSFAPNHTSKGV